MFFLRKKTEPVTVKGDPYRTPAEMPVETLPKPKREFKMPTIKVSKSIKIFLQLIPICVCAVGMGLTYDVPILTQGLKWGMGVSELIVAGFFATRIFVTIDNSDS